MPRSRTTMSCTRLAMSALHAQFDCDSFMNSSIRNPFDFADARTHVSRTTYEHKHATTAQSTMFLFNIDMTSTEVRWIRVVDCLFADHLVNVEADSVARYVCNLLDSPNVRVTPEQLELCVRVTNATLQPEVSLHDQIKPKKSRIMYHLNMEWKWLLDKFHEHFNFARNSVSFIHLTRLRKLPWKDVFDPRRNELWNESMCTSLARDHAELPLLGFCGRFLGWVAPVATVPIDVKPLRDAFARLSRFERTRTVNGLIASARNRVQACAKTYAASITVPTPNQTNDDVRNEIYRAMPDLTKWLDLTGPVFAGFERRDTTSWDADDDISPFLESKRVPSIVVEENVVLKRRGAVCWLGDRQIDLTTAVEKLQTLLIALSQTLFSIREKHRQIEIEESANELNAALSTLSAMLKHEGLDATGFAPIDTNANASQKHMLDTLESHRRELVVVIEELLLALGTCTAPSTVNLAEKVARCVKEIENGLTLGHANSDRVSDRVKCLLDMKWDDEEKTPDETPIEDVWNAWVAKLACPIPMRDVPVSFDASDYNAALADMRRTGNKRKAGFELKADNLQSLCETLLESVAFVTEASICTDTKSGPAD